MSRYRSMMSPGSKTVVVFDVNETLLDLSALGPHFSSLLPVEMMSLWFSQMLRSSMVSSMTDSYVAFDRHGVAALMAVGASADREISEREAEAVVENMMRLPPHPDVIPGLELLSDAGFRLATLTNSSTEVLERQVRNSGLSHYFEALISVDGVSTFKPDPRTYSHAARTLDVDLADICLVAAHDWDVTGAIRSGARAAFVRRGSAGMGLLGETPDIIGEGLLAVANSIVERFSAGS